MSYSLYAQNIGIHSDGSTPDGSAMLDVKSTTSGVLIPRMSQNDRDLISSPATGLLIYQTDNTPGFYYYDGTSWTAIGGVTNAWTLAGNSGTTPGTDFIGTTDNQDLVFKLNNFERFRIKTNGTLETSGGVTLGSGIKTISTDNVLIGYRVNYLNSGGAEQSVLIGAYAGYNSEFDGFTGALDNVSIGYYSMYNNTYGHSNVAIGSFAGNGLTTGYRNVMMGYRAGVTNPTNGIGNILMGYSATTTSSASNSVAIGNEATTASQSVVVGGTATTNNINAVVVGNSASVGGDGGIAVGNSTNVLLPDGVAIGNQASATRNSVAIGSYSTASVNPSVAVGLSAKSTGGGSTAIGWAANNNNFGNSSAFGAQSSNTGANQIRIGNASVTSIGGQVGWTTVSDGRFKTNINEDVHGLDFIMSLRPVTYNLDISKINQYLNVTDTISDNLKQTITYTGFIAQEVEASAKAINYNFSGVDAPKNGTDYYGLRYAEFVVPLVKAVQEQQKIIENLSKQVEELEKQIKNNNN